jgi:hypothetical protein
VSPVLSTTTLNLTSLFPDGKVQYADGGGYKPPHSPEWWKQQTRGFDFSSEDRVPAALFNRVIWEGIVGDRPYPVQRSGIVMRTLTTGDADMNQQVVTLK